jgi:hypothetical protein
VDLSHGAYQLMPAVLGDEVFVQHREARAFLEYDAIPRLLAKQTSWLLFLRQ